MEQHHGPGQCRRREQGVSGRQGHRPYPGSGSIAGEEDSPDSRGNQQEVQVTAEGADRTYHRTDQQRKKHVLQAFERPADDMRTAPDFVLHGRLFRKQAGYAETAGRKLRFRQFRHRGPRAAPERCVKTDFRRDRGST